jgi:DNA-binding NtrC family response regulator
MASPPLAVLLVDDEEKLLLSFKRSLESLRPEWTVGAVGSGAAAMKEMERRGYDVLVTDISMDGVDGVDVLHWASSAFPRVQRIVLSGMIDGRTLVEVKAHAHVHLIKPVMAEKLVERIESLGKDKPGASRG